MILFVDKSVCFCHQAQHECLVGELVDNNSHNHDVSDTEQAKVATPPNPIQK